MGPTKRLWNYSLEGKRLVVHVSPARWVFSPRSPSVSVHQLVASWEVAVSFSEFFLKTQHVCPFLMGDLLTYLPTLLWVFSSFRPENSMTPMPHPLYSPDLALFLSDFSLFPWMKKVLKGKCFADVEEMKQKMSEVSKGSKSKSSKTVFRVVKKKSHRCITSNGKYFEGDWSLNM